MASNNNSKDPYQSVEFLDALDDVHTRFILNLPESELQTADRIFFQLEQAWWFYEDLIADAQGDACTLPRFNTLKPFSLQLFTYSPLLPDVAKFPAMWSAFGNYKRRISNYGCILMNQNCTAVVLCKVWNSKTYTFPAGKINQGEDGATAAARETYEETGFDPACLFGLTSEWKDAAAASTDTTDTTAANTITWKTPLQEQDALVFTEDSGKRRTAYVCQGVPHEFPFEPVVRKEIAAVEWHKLDNIPKSSYAVMPFLPQLRRWIKKNNRKTSGGKKASSKKDRTATTAAGGANRSDNNSRNNSRNSSRTGSRGRVTRDDSDALVQAGLTAAGQATRWSEEDMFQANEKLMGRKVDYDGNPHLFAEQGIAGQQDPHAFHVVGGAFLNSASGVQSLAPPPDVSKLQPLFRPSERAEDSTGPGELQPFFSNDGSTPWGQVVAEAKESSTATGSTPQRQNTTAAAAAKSKSSKKKSNTQNAATTGSAAAADAALSDFFLTDLEITARSQASKTSAKQQAVRLQYKKDTDFISQWVSNLPKPGSSKFFGAFKLDADALLAGTPLDTPKAF